RILNRTKTREADVETCHRECTAVMNNLSPDERQAFVGRMRELVTADEAEAERLRTLEPEHSVEGGVARERDALNRALVMAHGRAAFTRLFVGTNPRPPSPCVFCNQSHSEKVRLIKLSNVYICQDCVRRARVILSSRTVEDDVLLVGGLTTPCLECGAETGFRLLVRRRDAPSVAL